MDKWQRLSSQIVFDTPYFNIRKDACRLPDGREIDDYYVYQTPDVALVVAYTHDHKVIFVEQYKHGIGDICLEIPGGYCEPDSDNPLVDAQRELREETGYVADEWHKLSSVIGNPTGANKRTHLYLALNASQQFAQSLDPNEAITVHFISKDEILTAIRAGRFSGTDTVVGLFLALDWLSVHKGE